MDIFTRESLAIEVGPRLKCENVVSTLNEIRQRRIVPTFLFCDNESEFTSQIMDLRPSEQNGPFTDGARFRGVA